MACEEHVAARHAWDSKPVLRTVYDHLYRHVVTELAPGSILEVGGGASRLTEYRSHAIVSDLMPSPYVRLAADAQQLPFAAGSFDNIVLFDVLHHIPVPRRFFAEAERVLRPEGRLIMMEPAITAGSYLFYRFLHPEPFDLSADPLAEAALSSDEPYDANQAIPTLLATRDRSRLGLAFPHFILTKSEWLSLFAYPMSGGLRPWSLLSASAARRLLAMEDRVPEWLRRRLAFRVMLVMRRRV
jgi:SAM-dependent methyltransferase